jgi:hypothetical protein
MANYSELSKARYVRSPEGASNLRGPLIYVYVRLTHPATFKGPHKLVVAIEISGSGMETRNAGTQ